MRIKPNGLWIAGLLVLLANGFVCINVLRNRAGTPIAEFELTDRELRVRQQGEDNSGVVLRLTFQNAQRPRIHSTEPSRKAYLALEYDGPAWREWRDQQDRQGPQPVRPGLPVPSLDQSSRLVLIDVGPDAAALRQKYPDATKVIILPGADRGDQRSAVRLEINTIHVPLPLSGALKGASHYRVRLRQGPSLEIWVAEVQRIVG